MELTPEKLRLIPMVVLIVIGCFGLLNSKTIVRSLFSLDVIGAATISIFVFNCSFFRFANTDCASSFGYNLLFGLPYPQAIILTAIVIGFASRALLLRHRRFVLEGDHRTCFTLQGSGEMMDPRLTCAGAYFSPCCAGVHWLLSAKNHLSVQCCNVACLCRHFYVESDRYRHCFLHSLWLPRVGFGFSVDAYTFPLVFGKLFTLLIAFGLWQRFSHYFYRVAWCCSPRC